MAQMTEQVDTQPTSGDPTLTVEVDALTLCQQCSVCSVVKPLGEFANNADTCNGCAPGQSTKRPLEEVEEDEHDASEQPTHKVCSKCNVSKEVSNYYHNLACSDGLHPMCKGCHNDAAAARRVAERRASASPQRRSTRTRKPPGWAANMLLGNDVPSTDSETETDDDDISAADARLAQAALRALQQSMLPPVPKRAKVAPVHETVSDKPAMGEAAALVPKPAPAAGDAGPVAAPAEAVGASTDPAMDENSINKKPPASKRCRACGEDLPASMFYTTKISVGQLSTNCKPCTSRINKERSIIRQTMGVDIPVTKVCRGCDLEKPADAFYRNKGAPDGLFARCKDCITNKRHSNMVEEPTVTHKVCRRCKRDKPASDFARNRSIKDGLYSWCRACDALKAAGRPKSKSVGPTVATKECGQCRMELAAARFMRDPNTIDGLSKRCKTCSGIDPQVVIDTSAPRTLLLGTVQVKPLKQIQEAVGAASHTTALSGTTTETATPSPSSATAPSAHAAPSADVVQAAMQVLAANARAPVTRPAQPVAPVPLPVRAAPAKRTSAFPSLNMLMGVPVLQHSPLATPSQQQPQQLCAEVLPADVELKLLPPE